MWRVKLGVRARILLIALIPSFTLAAVGIGTSITLVQDAQKTREYAQLLAGSAGPNQNANFALTQERLLSIWQLTGADSDREGLAAARGQVDTVLRQFRSTLSTIRESNSTGLDDELGKFYGSNDQLSGIREQIDSGAMSIPDVYQFFSTMLGGTERGAENIIADRAPDAGTALKLDLSLRLLRVIEAMSRSTALLAAPVNGRELPEDLAAELRGLVGYYRTDISKLMAAGSIDKERATSIITSPAWRVVAAVEDAVLEPQPLKPGVTQQLPVAPMEWRDAATDVNRQLFGLWEVQYRDAEASVAAAAADTESDSLLISSGILLLVLLALAVSVWLANRFVNRLQRLRTQMLSRAEVELPETMRRLRDGEDVDPEISSAHLDFGRDEIGQVAEAFNRAHSAAVGAAITESRTREGVRAVFLNIAHRFQLVVHRQLKLLDEAEARQEDPALLHTFFQLDHLATRARRNAENLIILGGGKPARQWRRPVPLMDVIRSAVSETIDYERVHTGRVPQAMLVGGAVADLIHLLAELVDNATSFSPPQSHVEVTSTVVGKGLAVEITDQGVGIPTDELEHFNEMLRRPPDFSLTALVDDSRLGLFVVARLAARNDISVRLSESDYGGIRAVVLVPNALIAADTSPSDQPTGQYTARTDIRSKPESSGAQAFRPGEALDVTTTTTFAPASEPEPPSAPRHSRGHPAPPSVDTAPARPALPRRRKQASLAPELKHEPAAESDRSAADLPAPHRSAENARDLMSAIEIGTRQGRRAEPDPYDTDTTSATPTPNEQDGDGGLIKPW